MAICNCPVYEFGVCLRATHVSESRLGCATGWRSAGKKATGDRWEKRPRGAYYLAAGWSTASDGRTKALEAIIVNRDTGPRGLSDNQLEAILVNAALGVRIFPHGPTTKRPESNAARVKRAGKWLLREFCPLRIATILHQHDVTLDRFVEVLAGIMDDRQAKASDRLAALARLRRLQALGAMGHPDLAEEVFRPAGKSDASNRPVESPRERPLDPFLHPAVRERPDAG